MEIKSLADIVIAGVLLIGAFEGYKRGFLLGILGLVGFVVAVILGFYFMDPMVTWLDENVETINIAYPTTAFLLIFLISIILINTVGWLLKKVMDLTILGTFDAFAGILFGVIKAGFFLSLFLWMTKEFDLDWAKGIEKDSELVGYIEPWAPAIIDWIEPFVPEVESTKSKLEEFVEKIKDATTD
ncbi:CvpA family protein [Algoriphagus sp. PAP.12]|uniref:CvpA family protein n=1 Tax=Algoriphagus sp. PAP.12 TaxID=2996678 RepID=UPI00227C9995|nr:CvpA family protein [Algoriphagus sp. PAP.12]